MTNGEESEKYRLVTRSDFDGLVCALLLKELDMIDNIKFVHPKDVQDGKIDLNEKDILTNLPYSSKALLVFDHHASETLRVGRDKENWVIDTNAPSASRVVYESFGGKERFTNISDEIMHAVDKADSAQFSLDDVLNPTGWELLSFIMDARTGLGRFRDFRISNQQLMSELIDHCKGFSIEEIMKNPDVMERVNLYREQQPLFIKQLRKCTKIDGKVGVIELRNEETIYAGNRFMVYALFPEMRVSMHVMWGKNKQNVVFACGKSIFNRDLNNLNIGEVMLKYGGGGHRNAGTCQVDIEDSDTKRDEIIKIFNQK
ncbi:MAG: hypothetical protein BWY78_00687 [Alphaproteobacteria bacterium ADurb.Bin438]|nr:MAG: hypothetical protein BWY78_00687 [Alphaproteobacteria bacterium ADurb.Bin438]